MTGDPLPPGTYTRTGFTPQITLDLDEGWGAFNLLNGLLAILVGGSAAQWEETLATAEPVVASVRIGE